MKAYFTYFGMYKTKYESIHASFQFITRFRGNFRKEKRLPSIILTQKIIMHEMYFRITDPKIDKEKIRKEFNRLLINFPNYKKDIGRYIMYFQV